MKKKIKVILRADEELCRKACAVAEHEGLTFNNYIIRLIRSSIAYHERVHGRIDPAKFELLEDVFENEE